jgi:hypothetical protein
VVVTVWSKVCVSQMSQVNFLSRRGETLSTLHLPSCIAVFVMNAVRQHNRFVCVDKVEVSFFNETERNDAEPPNHLHVFALS